MTESVSAGIEGPEVTVVATGLRFPEGPIALPDGSVLLVEIARGTVSRVLPDGEVGVVAETGGGPNGLALGPDGRCYVCNNGGFEWREIGGQPVPGLQGEDYEGGRIEAVDLDTGEIEVLYRESNRARPLRGPNDLVFDAHGGFWFTDLGKVRHADMDRGFVYYAKADGSECREVIRGLVTPNGIGLSPDGSTLYVAETIPGRIWAWDLPEPGVARLDRAAGTMNRGRLVAAPGGYREFDSLAVDSAGNVCAATLHRGGITVAAPDGSAVEHVPLPDPITTNVCFGGPELTTAWATLSGTGRLVSFPWPRPGLRLNYA